MSIGDVKALLLAVLSLAALGSQAFDSTAWFARREVLTREAERLKAQYAAALKRIDSPAEDVNIPLETQSDGAITLSIAAKKAQIFIKEDLVWAESVIIRKFSEDGKEFARIEADNCLFDRTTKSGWAEGRAVVAHGATAFRGEDVYFSAAEGYVMALKKSKIISRDLKLGGATL